MSTYVTVVRYNDQVNAFVHPPEERVHNLIDGAVDHFASHGGGLRRYLPHALVLDGDTMHLDPELSLGDHALRDALTSRDLRLVEIHADDASE